MTRPSLRSWSYPALLLYWTLGAIIQMMKQPQRRDQGKVVLLSCYFGCFFRLYSTRSRLASCEQSLVCSLLGSGVQDAASNNISTNQFTILQ